MRHPAPGGESFKRRRTRRQPPVGYQHGRRSLFVRRFPTLHWVYYFLFSHTTIRFYLMGLIGIVPTFFLLLAGFDSPAFLLGYAGIAWMLASLLVGWVCRPRLAVASEMPPRVECGSTFSARYHVRNTGRRTARSVTVESLIYYDTFQLRLPRPVLGMLAPGGMETLTGEGQALARGRYTLPALRWDSDFPLGFWRWGRTAVPERLLTVYPRYTRLESLDLPLGPLRQNELSASADLTREAFEFAGCREYRDGDALRHVHPRSSARLGVPVVKEFQTEGRSRTAILVETRGTNRRSLRPLWRKRSPFEAALSITASIVEALSTTDRVLELLVAGPEVYRFISAGRVGYFEEVLDILAGIEPCRDDSLDKLQPLLFEEIRMIQSVCLVLTRWDERRAQLVQDLAAWEVGLTVLLITPDGRAPGPLPLEVQCLSARAILRGEVDQILRK